MKLYCLKWYDYPSSSSLGETRHSHRCLLMLIICLSIKQLFIHTDTTSQCALCQNLTQSTDVCLCLAYPPASLFHILSINNFQCPWYFGFLWYILVLWLLHYASLSQSEHRAFCYNSHKSTTQLLRIVPAQYCLRENMFRGNERQFENC